MSKNGERHLRTMFEQLAVGIAEIAPDGRWLAANGKLCDSLGHPREELLRGTFDDIIAPADLEATHGDLRRLLAGEARDFAHEKQYVRKDGSLVWFNVSVTLIRNDAGAPAYFAGVFTKINARKMEEEDAERLHAELEVRVEQRTEELFKVNKDMESFTYSVSHDLRTPLRAINGFAQILVRRQRDRLDAQGQHYLDNVVEASTRMGVLIDEILQYARLGRQAVSRQPVDLARVFGNIRRYLESRMEATGGSIVFCGQLPTVYGDETLLYRIFVNLLENAIIYCKPGTPPSIEIGCVAAGDSVTVSVGDEGIGISSEHFERIFGLFQRLHTQDQYPGTGIGLATVRRSVELLGGEVWVESSVGIGTAFRVRLERCVSPGAVQIASAIESTAPERRAAAESSGSKHA